MVGGLASRGLIPAFGWEGVFIAAGALSLAILIPAATLPESVRFLIATQRRQALVASLLSRLDPSRSYSDKDRFFLASRGTESAARLIDLFRGGLAPVTLLLWLGVAADRKSTRLNSSH